MNAVGFPFVFYCGWLVVNLGVTSEECVLVDMHVVLGDYKIEDVREDMRV